MWSARFLSHMNHVSVSPTDGNGPTQGQRKTLTRVGIEPTTFGLDLRRSTDWATRSDGSRPWELKMYTSAALILIGCRDVKQLRLANEIVLFECKDYFLHLVYNPHFKYIHSFHSHNLCLYTLRDISWSCCSNNFPYHSFMLQCTSLLNIFF